MKKLLWVVAAILLVPLVGVVFVVVLLPPPKAVAECGDGKTAPGVAADVAGLPSGQVAGYGGEQLRNAALVVNAGKALKLSLHGQRIGVMTAMGESGLRTPDIAS